MSVSVKSYSKYSVNEDNNIWQIWFKISHKLINLKFNESNFKIMTIVKLEAIDIIY